DEHAEASRVTQSTDYPFFWGEIQLTTLRSHYQYEQFELVLQALAHKTAKEAVENLPQEGHIRIDGHKIERIERIL
ncbi:unnamed protein product, partial [marine sediment metagenome]